MTINGVTSDLAGLWPAGHAKVTTAATMWYYADYGENQERMGLGDSGVTGFSVRPNSKHTATIEFVGCSVVSRAGPAGQWFCEGMVNLGKFKGKQCQSAWDTIAADVGEAKADAWCAKVSNCALGAEKTPQLGAAVASTKPACKFKLISIATC